jgi:ribosomal-protein-alanine N-acetyltransferase
VIRVEPATVEWMEALAEGDASFATLFSIPVVPGWADERGVIGWVLQAARDGLPPEWGVHLVFDGDGALVGNAGWKGPPVDGVAELGYSVAPERRGQGIATTVVRELVARAAAAGVRLVIAHTLPEPSASTTVLSRCGFQQVGEAMDSNDGVLWRWELPV